MKINSFSVWTERTSCVICAMTPFLWRAVEHVHIINCANRYYVSITIACIKKNKFILFHKVELVGPFHWFGRHYCPKGIFVHVEGKKMNFKRDFLTEGEGNRFIAYLTILTSQCFMITSVWMVRSHKILN